MKNFTITLLFSSSIILSACGQTTSKQIADIVETDGITTPLHQANVGKIKFSSGEIPLKEFKESDFLSSFEMQEGRGLNFTAFFENSLSNYLHQLDTTLTLEELLEKGNFQFSFYVDDELLYTENLNRGAGLPNQKNKQTILYKPLINFTNADSWGRFLWMRFYYRGGGEDALFTGTHVLKMEIRPYLKMEELIVGDIIAEGALQLKWAETKVPEAQIAIQPIQANSGWEVSKDPIDEEAIRALNKKIAQNRFKNIKSIVVIKEGKLLLEEYFNDADRSTLHDVRSVGKTFASTMTGIALEEGHLKSTQQTLKEFFDLSQFANYSPKKDQVTIESLMTMSSGFDGNDDDYDSPGNEENMYPTDNWVKFTLDLGMDPDKEVGEKWAYFTAGVMLLGNIVNQAVPGGFEQYTNEKLFKPLGIKEYKWPYTPQNVPSTAGGIRMRSLDFAKYGQLYQNKGIWDGQQILPADWVEKSFSNYFHDKPNETPYGYLFWNHAYSLNGQSHEVFECRGNGGNKIIVFQNQPLVIIVTATAYNRPYAHPQVSRMLEQYILPAVLD